MPGTASPSARFSPGRSRRVRAKYDAAQITPENRRHWMQADHLSASAALNPKVREVIRSRARYEVANNGYARGMVNALANYVVGTGPRLQMLTDDPDANRLIEREFTRWAKAIGLSHKLWTMRVSQAESGEVFAVLATNPQIASAVQLDVRLVEADQVTTPTMQFAGRRLHDPHDHDGIRFDAFGNPIAYTVLRRHPGDTTFFKDDASPQAFDLIPAEAVIHLFRAERPGQSRGVPEITSSLSLYAMLRRYTLASLSAAEQAALPSGVIYSDAPADPDAAASVEPMDEVEMDRGTWLTMPLGWKIGQVKAEQPATIYSDFKHELVNEIARPLNMQFNIAAGNSSGYNYASGRLDHQAFFKAIRIDQHFIADVVLDRLLMAWLNEAVLIEGLLPQWLRERGALNHVRHLAQWFWDGLEHVDPANEANAQATRLSNHTTTLAIEYARQGLDWENELLQRAKEQALMQELGLSATAAPSPADEDDDPPDTDEPDTESTNPPRAGRPANDRTRQRQ